MGQRNAIECALAQHTYDPAQVEIVHADQVIEMPEEPSAAVHAIRDASVVVGTQLVKRAAAAAFVSAGNSGATLAAAQLFLGRLHGVRRAALGTVYPTPCTACAWSSMWVPPPLQARKPHQFESWGTLCTGVLGLAEPKVGLLSSGEKRARAACW